MASMSLPNPSAVRKSRRVWRACSCCRCSFFCLWLRTFQIIEMELIDSTLLHALNFLVAKDRMPLNMKEIIQTDQETATSSSWIYGFPYNGKIPKRANTTVSQHHSADHSPLRTCRRRENFPGEGEKR